jgi:hypothetical protein
VKIRHLKRGTGSKRLQAKMIDGDWRRDEAGTQPHGFNAAKHIAQDKLVPVRNQPVYVGLTLTDTVASVIAQSIDGGIEIYAAFGTEGAGLRYHLKTHLRPWLIQNAPWAIGRKLFGCYSEDLDREAEFAMRQIIEEILPGEWDVALQPLEARREVMLATFSEVAPFTLLPKFKVSPDASLIAPALNRQWDARDKSVYAAVVNALSLVISRMTPRVDLSNYKPPVIESSWDPRFPVED